MGCVLSEQQIRDLIDSKLAGAIPMDADYVPTGPVDNGNGTKTVTFVHPSMPAIPVTYCTECADDDEIATPDGNGGHVDNEGDTLPPPATDINGVAIDPDTLYLINANGEWCPKAAGADFYSEAVTVAADGTATDSNGNPVTPPAGAQPGDILDVNFDENGNPIDVCYAGDIIRETDCYHETHDAKGVFKFRRARHRFPDPHTRIQPSNATQIAGAANLHGPQPTTIFVEEVAVLQMDNPDDCFDMNVMGQAGGRSKILSVVSQDSEQWSNDVDLDMQVRFSFDGFWKSAALQQMRHDVNDRMVGNSVFQGAVGTVGPAATVTVSRRAVYRNNNDAGEGPAIIQFNLAGIHMMGDIQHVD